MNRLRHPASLRVRLLVFLLAAIALTAAVQGLLAYRSALVEADALFDYQMQQTAYALRAGLPPDARASGNALPEYQNDELIVQVWTNEGLRIFESALGDALPQMAVLGFAEVDRLGNVNAHSFNNRMVGAGGFIDITQNVKKLCFIGTFTAGKQTVKMKGDGLSIHTQGPQKKFLHQVEAITFSGREAVRKGQEVLYITERAVFRLEQEGLTLVEIAHGVDLQRDILDQMEFKPVIPEYVRYMDPRLFREGPMGLTPEQMEMLDPEYEFWRDLRPGGEGGESRG